MVRAISTTPPTESLSGDFEITSEQDLALAMRWLAWLRGLIAAVEGRLKQDITKLGERAAQEMLVPTEEGESLPAAALAQILEERVQAFCKKYRRHLFRDAKSINVEGGKIVDHLCPEKLDTFGKNSFSDIVVRLATEAGLYDEVAAVLDRLELCPWLKVTFELDKSGIKRALADGEISEADLKARLLRVSRDRIFKVSTD